MKIFIHEKDKITERDLTPEEFAYQLSTSHPQAKKENLKNIWAGLTAAEKIEKIRELLLS